MKRILACVLAVLLAASATNAAIISAPSVGYVTGLQLEIPISVSGGELIKSATISIAIAAGRITGLERQVGLFAGSSNVVDPPSIYTDSQGRSAVWSDYSLAFTQTPVAANGVIAILHVDTAGMAPGWYDILLSGTDGGDTSIADAQGLPIQTTIRNGAMYHVPEPFGLTLLPLGGLFVWRRARLA